jgi:hypothetical protein
MTWRFHAVFAVFATLGVAVAIGLGFVMVGSPGARRLERYDELRLRNLQAIAREVHAMVVDVETRTLKGPLPKTLKEVAQRARTQQIKLLDPETGEPYAYAVKNDSTIELCATFTQARDSDYSVFWNHPAGTRCFTIDLLDPPPFY